MEVRVERDDDATPPLGLVENGHIARRRQSDVADMLCVVAVGAQESHRTAGESLIQQELQPRPGSTTTWSSRTAAA